MLDRDRALALLRRGGLDPEAGEVGPYQATSDPSGAEVLGRELAALVADLAPTVVVVWRGVSDAVLGHIVARELGTHVVLTFDDDGLVEHRGPLGASERAVVVADRIDDPAGLAAVITYLEQQGAVVAALGTLVAGPADRLGHVERRSVLEG